MTSGRDSQLRDAALQRAAALARQYLLGLDQRPVAPPVDVEQLRRTLGGALADAGEDPTAVIEALYRGADPGIVASAGPRYFGFVTGGALPAALGADWLTSAWDQNAWTYVASPAASVVEETAGRWLVELLGLPADTSVGFTTGATMASFTALAAARSALLSRCGYDVEERGLRGAPEIHLFAGDAAHVTIFAALQMLGLGRANVRRIAADEWGRMRPDRLREALRSVSGPAIVCSQAGEVNAGGFDPFEEIAGVCETHGAWHHVDGAFGLWAAASPSHRHLVRGAERADSWTVDGHKWLNVPYDSGYVFVRDPAAHRAAFASGAAYYPSAVAERVNFHYVPESSRRARGFPTWAALRSLGKAGVAQLVERCCFLARRMADNLRGVEGVELLNEVVLNQVLVRFRSRVGEREAFTQDVIRRIQNEGTCWLGGTTWRGETAARISISNASTRPEDVDASATAIAGCVRAARA